MKSIDPVFIFRNSFSQSFSILRTNIMNILDFDICLFKKFASKLRMKIIVIISFFSKKLICPRSIFNTSSDGMPYIRIGRFS